MIVEEWIRQRPLVFPFQPTRQKHIVNGIKCPFFNNILHDKFFLDECCYDSF